MIIAATQFWLVLSGNFSWLNWVTIILAVSVVDTSALAALGVAPPAEVSAAQPLWYAFLVIAFTSLVVVRSWYPARNLVSRRQRMNSTFDPLHMVNAYGAFGSISRTREEVILEGSATTDPDADIGWLEYEFKGKPGDVRRMPRQWSPYHLRLDWMMWFLPISPSYAIPG